MTETTAMRQAGAELLQRTASGPRSLSYLAEVVAVDDPEGRARVQVRLLSYDGPERQDAPIWARVAVPFAGANRGAFLLPDVGDEVLVTMVNGDPRQPVVVGSLWNGADQPPESLGGSGDQIDRWTLVGKAGTRIAIVEERSGEARITFETPGGVSGELTDAGGGSVEFSTGGTTITQDTGGVTIVTPATVEVKASQVKITAGQVTVDAAVSRFSGLVQCDVLKATNVVAKNYCPGAGNVW